MICPFAHQKNLVLNWLGISMSGLGCLLVLLFPTNICAATYDIADGDVNGLINAINLANGNSEADTINLATNSIYTPATYDNLIDGANAFPIITSEIYIEGNGAKIQRPTTALNFRFFDVASGYLKLFNLTLDNGRSEGFPLGGGAILNQGNLDLNKVILTNNYVDLRGGGGIWNSGLGIANVENSEISHNYVSYSGSGGAIQNRGEVHIKNTSMHDNYAQNTGGAIYIYSSKPSSVDKAIIINNGVENLGSAIYLYSGSINIDKTLISNNKTSGVVYGKGGALFSESSTSTSITDSILNNNTSINGAGLMLNRGLGSIVNSCVSGNTTTSIVNESVTTLNATGNWWGDPSGPSGAGPGTGDSVSGNVNFTPFLTVAECPVELYKSYDVPYFSQKDPEWKDHAYDNALNWKPPATPSAKIETWGCSLSSVAMLLKYFGVNNLPNGVALTPDTLNVWFNTQEDGEWREGATPWGAVTRLTKIMNDQDSTTKLEYHKITAVNNDYSLSDFVFAQNDIPHIMELQEARSPSGVHFVVTNGVIKPSQKYSILDPYVGARKLLATESGLISLRVFEPTNSNFSYLFIHLDSGLNASLKADSGATVGLDGSVHTDQPGSWYDWQPPLAADGADTYSGVGFTELAVPKPLSDDYQLSLSSASDSLFDFELYAYDADSNPDVVKKQVFVSNKNPLVYRFRYNQTEGLIDPEIKYETNFERLKELIDYAYNQGWVDAYSHKRFIKEVEQSEKWAQKPKKIKQAIQNLDTLKLIVEIFTNLRIKPEARNLLISEIDLIIEWLNSGV